jgi:hypothetical protein
MRYTTVQGHNYSTIEPLENVGSNEVHTAFQEEAKRVYTPFKELSEVTGEGRSTGPVILVEAPTQMHSEHYVRKSLNPEWYRDMYRRGVGRRQRVLQSLERIIEDADHPSDEFPFATTDKRMRDLLFERTLYGQKTKQGRIPPRNDIREYFSLERVIHGYELQTQPQHEPITSQERVVKAPF